MPEPQLALASLSRVTGLSAHVIRVWERRYGFPQPDRTEGGHRRYSRADAERLRQAAVLTRSGMRAADAITLVRDQPASVSRGLLTATSTASLVGRLTAGEKLASLMMLREAWLALGLSTTLETIVFPALREIGERWATGQISVSAEHAASGIVLSWLGSLRAEFPWNNRPVRVLVAAVEGEEHVVPIWALELLLAEAGVSALALGASAPTTDVIGEAGRRRVRAVVFGIERAELKPGLRKAARLNAALPSPRRALLFAGGAGASAPLPAGVRALPGTVTASATQLVAELKPGRKRP